MKLDINEKGWDSVFMPWQRRLWEAVYKYPDGMNSRKGWEHLEGERSRASVINTLVLWAEEGLLKSVDRTGKGGHHKVYFPKCPDVEDLEAVIKLKFHQHIAEELEGTLLE